MTASLQTLMTQFRARYPMGSLLSEFQTVHGGLFVVRAIAQIGGTPLSSGLAAEPTIEQAEDRAKIRAIEALGIQSFMSTLTPAPLGNASLPAPLAEPAPSDVDLFAIAQPSSAAVDEPIPPPSAMPIVDTARSTFEDFDHAPPVEPVAEVESIPEFRAPAKEVRRRATPEVPPAPEAPSPPMDLSDVIAQTSVELKRLGWTEPQGRKHLQQTYNKRSRQQLTDDELLDFLKYLQTQPSP